MSTTPARDAIFRLLTGEAICPPPRSQQEAGERLDAHTVEVENARDEVIIAWLGKKAREYRNTGTRQGTVQADAVDKMADKLRRGAARKNNLLGAPELTVYRAQHDAIPMGLYTTRQAAYEHCEAHELRDDPASPMFWKVDEDGVAELHRTFSTRSPGADAPTGFVVTPLTVASHYDEEADE